MRVVSAVIVACAVALSGCATTLPPAGAEGMIDASRVVQYGHPADDVRAAYRHVVQARGLRIYEESDSLLVAVPRRGEALRVSFAPGDSALLAVRTVYSYPRMRPGFRNLAYFVPGDAARELGRDHRIAPEYAAVFPSSDAKCESTSVDLSTDDVAWPELVGGLEALRGRLIYPEPARLAAIEGTVFVQALIGPAGGVECVRVIAGLGGGINDAAILALLTSPFRAGSVDGEPAALWVSLPITYRLTSERPAGARPSRRTSP